MTIATLTTKAKLTLPKAVRDARELKGMFAGRLKTAATLEEIKTSVARGAVRRFFASSR